MRAQGPIGPLPEIRQGVEVAGLKGEVERLVGGQNGVVVVDGSTLPAALACAVGRIR